MGIFSRPKRPEYKLQLTPIELIVELAALAAILLNIALEVVYWPTLPAQVQLNASALGNTRMIFLFLTIIAAFVYACLSVMSLFPQLFNYPVEITAENAPRQYRHMANMMRSVKLEIMLAMLYIEWAFIQAGQGTLPEVSPLFIPALLVALALTMGYFLFQMISQK